MVGVLAGLQRMDSRFRGTSYKLAPAAGGFEESVRNLIRDNPEIYTTPIK